MSEQWLGQDPAGIQTVSRLARLLFDFHHLERLDDRHYLSTLAGTGRVVEIVCNRFAGEFLAPAADFELALADCDDGAVSDETVSRFARTYSVSRAVILRKFREWSMVGSTRQVARRGLRAGGQGGPGQLAAAHDSASVAPWRTGRSPSSGGGGNYYATQATYLGAKYLRALAQQERARYGGRCPLPQ